MPAALERAFSLQPALRDDARRAALLRAVAAALSRARDRIIAVASAETALTPDELAPEFARMTRTLAMFAGVVEDGRWTRASHTPAAPTHAPHLIGPNHDLRSHLIPLRGVVVVFGASNFPLAYGVCGGDTASALAAGCPVVVKEHPAHRATGRLIADTARAAIKGVRATGFDPDILGYVEDDGTNSAQLAQQLIEHRATAAVGFTGSLAVGTQLHRLAANRPFLHPHPLAPIPVFAEMGSVNPSVIFPAALASRGDAIIEQLAASITQRHGQQCTSPGIILALDPHPHPHPTEHTDFAARLAAAVAKSPPRRMISPSVRANFVHAVASLCQLPEVRTQTPPPRGRGPGGGFASSSPASNDTVSPIILETTAAAALAHPAILHTELFGPAAVVIRAAPSQAAAVLDHLPGTLTLALWYDPAAPGDMEQMRALLPAAESRAGRIIFNGIPTGVRVCESMTHGGPWPATNRPDSTAVGARAIERWCRWVSWQGALGEGEQGPGEGEQGSRGAGEQGEPNAARNEELGARNGDTNRENAESAE